MSRDYTYVSDVVSAIERALECTYRFEIFNVGNSRPVRLDHMIETLEGAMGKKARRIFLPTPPAEMPVTFASLDKSRKLLGYSPKVTFEEGIRLFVEWYKGQEGLGTRGWGLGTRG
jgi:UDP-glucuronate 4-epimerase